ncbi:PrpF protein-domain-containing protein, partial [Astrocystis sublimbata]
MPPSAPRIRPRCLLAYLSCPAAPKVYRVTEVRDTGLHTLAAVRPECSGGRPPHFQVPRSNKTILKRVAASSRNGGCTISTTASPACSHLPKEELASGKPKAKSLEEKGQRALPALFVRSGTSNGLVLRASDLPLSASGNGNHGEEWARILPAAMGSPDPLTGRQLDGMGGGISSTSKVCVLAPSRRDDADVDFTFVQVGVRDGKLDMEGNCGNMSAVVGPVAWDWGYLSEREKRGRIRTVRGMEDGGMEGEEDEEEYTEAFVRVFNTNTSKIIHARFRVRASNRGIKQGEGKRDGGGEEQSRITLSFIDPAGAKTRRALPTGNAVDVLDLPDGSTIRASLVDVSNPGVFVALEELGLRAGKANKLTPAAVEADEPLKARLEIIRRAGAERMGLDPEVESVPKIVLLLSPDLRSGRETGDGGGV